MKLTFQQIRVLRLILAGKQDKEIAAELGISKGMVSQHKNAIFIEYDVNCRAALFAKLGEFEVTITWRPKTNEKLCAVRDSMRYARRA